MPLECEARQLVCGQTRKELRHRLKTARLQATVKLGGLKQLSTQRARRSRVAPCRPTRRLPAQVRCGVLIRYCARTRSDGGRSVNSASSARIVPLMFPSGDQRRDDASTRAREHTSSVDDASRRHLGGRLPLVLGAAEGCHGHAMRSLVLSAMPPRVVGPEGDVPFVPHGCH